MTFLVGTEQLQLYNRDMQRVVEPGDFELMVGSNSQDLEIIQLTVTED